MGDSGSGELLAEQRGAVLWLTIQREERRNAISPAVLAGMGQAIEAAQGRRDLRAIVITGAGTRAFCAGADLQAARPSRSTTPSPTRHLANLLRLARRQHRAADRARQRRLHGRRHGPAGHVRPGGGGAATRCSACPRSRSACSRPRCCSVLQHLLPRRVLAEMCLTGEPHHGRAGAGLRPGQLRGRRLDARLRLAAGPPAGQVARRDPPRPVHDEEDRGDVVRGIAWPSPKARSPCSP